MALWDGECELWPGGKRCECLHSGEAVVYTHRSSHPETPTPAWGGRHGSHLCPQSGKTVELGERKEFM